MNQVKDRKEKHTRKKKKDHIYLRKKLKQLGRTRLEVLFESVSPVGDTKTIDRDGVLTILNALQITSAGKDSVLSDLGFSGEEGEMKIVLSIDEFEKMI